jgi:hypothetical protein
VQRVLDAARAAMIGEAAPETGAPAGTVPGAGSTARKRPAAGPLGFAPDSDEPTDQFPAIRETARPAAAAAAVAGTGVGPAPTPARGPEPGPADPPGPRRRPGRRYRRAASAAAVATVLVAGSVAYIRLGPSRAPTAADRAADVLRHAAATRDLAATWIAGQVTTGARVSCDPGMCAVLRAHGIPGADLVALGPGSGNPLGATIIVATAVLRRQLGGRLNSVYAPGLIARFGSGAQRIDVRVIAEHGASAYREVAGTDLRERQESGAELARSARIMTAGPAGTQLAAGQIDSRLMLALASLASLHPLEIVAFGNRAPGVSAVLSPFRSAELVQAPDGPSLSGTAFIRLMTGFMRAQHAPYAAASMKQLALPGGQVALRLQFSAPGPFGLLSGSASG